MTIEQLNLKIGNSEFNELKNTYTPLRFVNWLIATN